MGIDNFLPRLLESTGQVVDLRDFASEGITVEQVGTKRKRRRPLRIGIDVSSWVCRASFGFGEMLGDERHLTNYGRAALVDEQNIEQRQLPEQHDNGGAAESAAAADDSGHNENFRNGRVPKHQEGLVNAYVESCTKYVIERIETLRDTSQADLLVVLDGKTPPMKAKEVERRRNIRQEQERRREEPVNLNEADIMACNERRTKAFRRAGAGRHHSAILQLLKVALRRVEVPFLVAPYEADGQLAYLSQRGYIDLIVTEDSDLVAHGATSILYKSTSEISGGRPKGVLFQRSDIGAMQGTLNFADFTPVMLAVLFVASGCDYCNNLKGIGLARAAKIVRRAFLGPLPSKHSTTLTTTPPLEILFSQLYTTSSERKITKKSRSKYEESFLNALLMYRHPVVFDPIQRKCIIVRGVANNGGGGGVVGDEELISFPPYAKLCQDFGRIQQIVGNLPAGDTTCIANAEGHVDIGSTGNHRTTTNKDGASVNVNSGSPAGQPNFQSSMQRDQSRHSIDGIATTVDDTSIQDKTLEGANDKLRTRNENIAHAPQDDTSNTAFPVTSAAAVATAATASAHDVNGSNVGNKSNTGTPAEGEDDDDKGHDDKTIATTTTGTASNKSPNLLCSSTSQPSESTQSQAIVLLSSSSSSKLSPNLLVSSTTPEKNSQSSQE